MSPIARRRFITGAVCAFAAPLAAGAQAGKVARIGYMVLSPLTDPPSPERAAFLAGLRALGYIEGKSIIIEYRSAKWNPELFHDLAEDLVRLNVDVIVTTGGRDAAAAAKKATATIPIVMAAGDPVGAGLAASLSRPGGNVTGLSILAPELGGKRLQLLKEAAPGIGRVAVLWSPSTSHSGALEWQATEAAARALGISLRSFEFRGGDDLAKALAAISRERADALTMLSDPFTSGYREIVADFARKNRLPTVFGTSEYVRAGGLMSYAPNAPDLYSRAAVYVDRILKGAKPGDLPIEQPKDFELVINLKTAKALGLPIPPSLLARADQIIE
jgi:putative ABC transport system substrate-binding protein